MIDPFISHEASVDTSNRTLRQFAGLWVLFFGGLACWEWLMRDRVTLAMVFAMVALLVGPLGLVRPQAIRPVFTGMMTLTYPIGWVVSHLLLGLLFYGIFTPVALFFRLIGRDALCRWRPSGRETYWVGKPATTDVRNYLRQF